MKNAQRSEWKARIALFGTILTGALILGPVENRWPDSSLSHTLTLMFAIAVVTSLLYTAATIVAQGIVAVRFVYARVRRSSFIPDSLD